MQPVRMWTFTRISTVGVATACLLFPVKKFYYQTPFPEQATDLRFCAGSGGSF